MIANLANDLDKDGNPHIYNGIDAEGKPMKSPSHPVIEGRLHINGRIYEKDYEALKAVFSNLAMEFLGFYISFKDPEVLRVLLANITTDDGLGLTAEDIEGVTTMGTWFDGNTEIETFNELSRFIGLASFNMNAFRNCTSLKSISIPPQITSTSINQFSGCSSLADVNIQTPLKVIESGTFRGCTEFEGVDLSELEELRNASAGVGVFLGTKIKEFNAPKLKTLGTTSNTAHFQETPIERVVSMGEVEVLPDGSANYSVFNKCQSLVEGNLPPTLKTIGAYCFNECSALETINIPTSVTKIGNSAFQRCSSLYLDEVNLPNLTTFGSNVFAYVKVRKINLGKLTSLPAGSANLQNYGDKSVLEEIVLGDGITSLPGYAFGGYTNLRTINIPQSVTTIGANAFANCRALAIDIDLPNLTSVDYYAFSNSGILSFSADKLSTLAAGNTFSGSASLKSLSIPLVERLGARECLDCTALETVDAPSVTVMSYDVFKNWIDRNRNRFLLSTCGHCQSDSGCNDQIY